MVELNNYIAELIQTDDGYEPHYADKIKHIYNTATKDEKEKINMIFMYLTGYELGTILNNVREEF